MSELTVGQIIKLILGVFVVIAVITGLYFAFKNNIIDFFENLPGSSSEIILGGLI